jgi:hypothetical protein
MDIPGNEIAIHHINPANGDNQVIYQGDAYAVGRMTAAADGKILLFSQIANQEAWIKAIADRTLDVVNDYNGDGQRALVPVSLYRLTLGSSVSPTLVGENLAQFVIRSGGAG